VPGKFNPPRSREFGLDAGAVFGLGDNSSFQFNLPTARARLGFFLPNNGRWSLEPAVGLAYFNTEESDGVLAYNLELGGLYHVRAGSDLPGGHLASTAYVRPFVSWAGTTGDNGDSDFSIGAGLGMKIPWHTGVAVRLEGNAGYGFDNEAFRLGANVGLSVFTRHTP
jgi:hypothetical protein